MAMPIWFEPNKLNMWTWRGRVGGGRGMSLFMSTWIQFPLTSTNSGITCCPKSRVCFPIPKTLELTFNSEIASKPYLIGTGSGLGLVVDTLPFCWPHFLGFTATPCLFYVKPLNVYSTRILSYLTGGGRAYRRHDQIVMLPVLLRHLVISF